MRQDTRLPDSHSIDTLDMVASAIRWGHGGFHCYGETVSLDCIF